MPYIALALIARAALRHYRGGSGEHGPGRGPWAWGGRPDAERGWGYGPPWRRGGRHRHGSPDADRTRESFRTMRHEVGELVALLRGAARHGAPDARQMSEIRAVLGDARKRIAAILAETQQPPTIV